MIFSLGLTSLFSGWVATVSAQSFPPGVLATGTMGPTNPPEPTLGTAINQSSISRLITLNSIDDFCLLGPPALANISDSETIEVAWCTKQRNNARLIPDGTITGASFLKTDFYVQIMGFGDFTKLNIPFGDFGGELDPHGATGAGNPIGGNVTSNITGSDQLFAEWMLYISFERFCFRICINANSTYSAANMCWHELDEVGCDFVMPDPPGWYPTATINGTPVFSTFAQRFTGTLAGGSVYTVGDLSTPAGAFSTPSSSNCVTVPTISNGVALASLGISQSGASTSTPTITSGSPGSTSGNGGNGGGTNGGPPQPTSGAQSDANGQFHPITILQALAFSLLAVLIFH